MTLLRAHELMLALTTLSSYLAVLLGGSLPLYAWLACIAPVLAFLMRSKTRPYVTVAKDSLWVTFLGLLALGAGAWVLFAYGLEAAVLAGTYSVMSLLAARLLSRGGLRDDGQALLLAFLVLVAGAALNHNLSYAFCFFLFSFSALAAMTTRELLAKGSESKDAKAWHVMCQRRDIVGVRFAIICASTSLVVMAMTAVFFTLFPRVGVGALPFFQSKSGGLPDSVRLNNGAIRTVAAGKRVARVKGVSHEDFERGLYLRGPVFDAITLDGFSKGPPQSAHPILPLRKGEAARYQVELSPVGNVFLTLGESQSLRVVKGGTQNPNIRLNNPNKNLRGEWISKKHHSSVLYQVFGELLFPLSSNETITNKDRFKRTQSEAPFLSFEDDAELDALSLALELKSLKSRSAIAKRIREHLSSFRYSLAEKPISAKPPMLAFLTEYKEGHCEYFAGAFATLLRHSGVPARVVGGFQGGEWDADTQEVRFSGSHAHAWIEWLHEDGVWVLDDATPQSRTPPQEMAASARFFDRLARYWDDQVIDYAFVDQMRSLRSLSNKSAQIDYAKPAMFALVLVGGATLLLLWRKRASGRDTRAHPLAKSFESYLASVRDKALGESETYREGARFLLKGNNQKLLERCLARLEEMAYAQASSSSAEQKALDEKLVRALNEAQKRHQKNRGAR